MVDSLPSDPYVSISAGVGLRCSTVVNTLITYILESYELVAAFPFVVDIDLAADADADLDADADADADAEEGATGGVDTDEGTPGAVDADADADADAVRFV
jgi:hypothetical protein